MSRLGLRSCSDSLKLLEEKNNRRKITNFSAISSKRILNQRESKFVARVNNNQENFVGSIQVETDEIEKYSDTSDKLANNKNIKRVNENYDNDEYSIDNGNDNDNNGGDNYRKQFSICKRTLVCSLPLDRINEIIQKLDLNKSNIGNEKESDEIIIEEMLDNDDDEEDDTNVSKQSSSNIKNLCLYCDRKFSSHKMQLKHVDKFHCLQQDRRCSGRNVQLQQQQKMQIIPRKRKSAIESQNFPGCNFCHKNKGQSQPVILPATELSSLFLHLIECHTDKYFGCKTCVIRFQNISKLSKHMEIVHKSLPFVFDESSSKSRDNDTDSLVSIDKLPIGDKSKLPLKRQQRSQKSVNNCLNLIGTTSVGTVDTLSQCSTAIVPNTSVIGAEEPILSRLGLTQNRLPNNRKGVRLRREKLLPEMLFKSEHNHTSTTNFAFGLTTSISATSSSCTSCSPKFRGKPIKGIGGVSGDTTADVVFRVPTRSEILSCVFDDNFYKEVVSNVRKNLLLYLDGKIMGNSMQDLDTSLVRHANQPQIRSTLAKSPIIITTEDSEIHAATSLAAITAFPTLLTAEQFGGDASSSKIRRPHTKNSWKWKWDSVKKFKLINEGGKIVKKIKHPMLGLRDLSKLDMWTQLAMRQKHELQQQQKANLLINDNQWQGATTDTKISLDPSREEKQRINDQLNFILDMRLLPHIILEQNEQAIIKLENDEFGIAPTQIANEDCGDNLMAQTFADENFLSFLNLLPNYETQNTRSKLVLSGEWARPRCYLCICCGAKFEKLKSLEEHKMFRHSQILSTHYEVVGRELLNGNLLRHLFIPKKALSRYGNGSDNFIYSGAARRLFWRKKETLISEIANNEESSDSIQSVLHSCVANSPSLKNNSSSTEDCDIDSKMATTAALQLIESATIVSPTHSIQSFSSSSSSGMKSHLKIQTSFRTMPMANANVNSSTAYNNSIGSGCSKCGRKCNGVLDLYRHMLDCSGDYIWSLAKKRKYRYYCGSKKRRPCNKHSFLELRKNKNKIPVKSLSISNDNTTEESAISSSNLIKIKSSPRSRPSDAESIKKMLENLPPKRICKKIFPTLSKAKKSIKNVKPKLLAKHKIYNSLRKTRVRQMAQVAKILSKTKSQLNNPKKMATRSTNSTISSKVSEKRSNKKKKSIEMAMNKNCEIKLIKENQISTEDSIWKNKLVKYTDELDSCSVKTEIRKAKDVLLSTICSDRFIEEEKNAQISKNSCDLFISNNSKENVEKFSKPEELTNPYTKQTNEAILNVSYSTTQKNMSNEVQNKDEQNKALATNTIISFKTDHNIQINTKSVKRTKRISDCIAMLTGKLEEKLKTEQKMLDPLIAEKVSLIPQALNTSTSADTPLPIHCQPTLVSPKLDEKETEKSFPKKFPKRKTISRRIIKTDVKRSAPLPFLTANSENKNHFNHHKNPVEIIAPIKDVLVPKQSAVNQISTTQQGIATTNFIQSHSELVFLSKEIKQPINIIPEAVVRAMPPPVGRQNESALMQKMPLFIPLENMRQTIAGSHMALPMSLPVPVPVPVPLSNVSQTCPAPIPTAVTTNGAKMISTQVIPKVTAVDTHLATSSALQLTVTSNAANVVTEPLNLSNSLKNIKKQSQDLSRTVNQRVSTIPARRQTICGFEVRNFTVFDEMEPLDLSKKPRSGKIDSSYPPKHIELASRLLPPPQPPLGIPNESSILAIPTLASEALHNKPFYSNLDLLRIPQVRNPVRISTEEPIQPAFVNATSAIAQPAKMANKKRNKPSVLQTTNNVNILPAKNTAENLISISASNTPKMNNAKDITNSISKKESYSKNKTVVRMDEEVISHIDDAINSVINAVKASLDNEEALKAQEKISIKSQIPSQPLISTKSTDDVNDTIESVAEFKCLTAARRNMRSKTLDYRPAACLKFPSTTTASVAVSSNATTIINKITPSKSTNKKNIDIGKYVDNIADIKEISFQGTSSSLNDQLTTKREIKKNESQLKFLELESKFLEGPSNANYRNQNKVICQELSVQNTITQVNPSVEIVGVPLIPAVNQAGEAESKNVDNLVTTSSNNLDVENMSNNNNTSSGFHSSVQSDQQTSAMSTTTSAVLSTVDTVGDMKKKQKRRRKNELAAIVADQLLESFKLDKARRDNLKKLENLAYEKSEDLLLTGMLLMSSTKRNAASSSISNIHSQVDNTESTVSIKRFGKFERNHQSSEVRKQNHVNTIENKPATDTTVEKYLDNDRDTLEVGQSGDEKKNSKRRQYRRRGKTLSNANISRLKSSLESFSIDIERQLIEYEAKSVNVLKNVESNENAKQSYSSKNQIPANVNKTSIILRPSILSVALETTGNQEVSQNTTKNLTNHSNKTVVSSRDPRINKNIHKVGEKSSVRVGICTAKEPVIIEKNTGPEEIGDLEEDNYLTEIAKNVNQKIMSTENEEFAFKDDGLELVNGMGIDDSNSKFSRPPTSMSVRSAPSLNDDRSNFGYICDENTNTEVMTMDLEDEISVYTSYSQDLGRGRGRRRRRRRSILLTRKPKKRTSSRHIAAEKLECILCKKVFNNSNSLSKHNMTLAHVSKVSEQEYLLSKSHSSNLNLANSEKLQTYGNLDPYARRSTRRSTISEPPMQSCCILNPSSSVLTEQPSAVQSLTAVQSSPTHAIFKSATNTTQEKISMFIEDLKPNESIDAPKSSKTLQKLVTKEQVSDTEYEANINANEAYNGNSRLNLNPDERLFFECCNILKSAETPRLNNVITSAEECNINDNFSYAYDHQEKLAISNENRNELSTNILSIESPTMRISSNAHTHYNQMSPPHSTQNNVQSVIQQSSTELTLCRDPQLINQSSHRKVLTHGSRNARSPTYSAISHLSTVTNTTSKFKTKAAMKGYENVKTDLNQQPESKSRTICKLTELAEIALGNEEKPNSHDFSPIQMSTHIVHQHQAPKINIDRIIHPKGSDIPEYVTTLVNENITEYNAQMLTRSECTKKNDTRSSTSSKTIMHSSIIKAAVEEHQKSQVSKKIIIPDRPFKNIGLEEKETITFQKPKAPAVNLLSEDNSISTESFSDRDDYDFGSLSCDDEASVRESSDKNQKNDTETSSESSRATAKTFENKSLIMGRIFKNASTKASIKSASVNTVKVKSVGIQKDQIFVPKADLNQIFDELRCNSGVDGAANDRIHNANAVQDCPVSAIPIEEIGGTNNKQYEQECEARKPFIQAASPPLLVNSTTATLPTNVQKTKARIPRTKSCADANPCKDLSKLQTELGMSPDEIKKLIDEGQRKSKRRCATNRPKKLVEMWSSDEYEEFLSTKDIIALIEEKEQLERRKKRKSALNICMNKDVAIKEKARFTDMTSSTKDPKRRSTRRVSVTTEPPENLILNSDKILPTKNIKTKKTANKKKEFINTTANNKIASEIENAQKFMEALPEKVRRKRAKTSAVVGNSATITISDNNVSGKKCFNKKNNGNKLKNNLGKETKQISAANEISRGKCRKRQHKEDKKINKNVSINNKVDNDHYDDDDDDFLISELKNKQNKTHGGKMKNGTSISNTNSSKLSLIARKMPIKNRGNTNTNCSISNIASSSNPKNSQHQPSAKTKRKNVSNQSPPRRKRLATEKLYYWSSSSDEDFGRINNNKSNLPPNNFESSGEQYQKHGWIVGDSHKKLVTLLAIAKGNKKVDSNSGVKKNIGKKRS